MENYLLPMVGGAALGAAAMSIFDHSKNHNQDGDYIEVVYCAYVGVRYVFNFSYLS